MVSTEILVVHTEIIQTDFIVVVSVEMNRFRFDEVLLQYLVQDDPSFRCCGTSLIFGFQCRDFHTENITDICAFVNATDDCHIDEGFINYTIFIYCQFSSHLVALGVVIVVSILYGVGI